MTDNPEASKRRRGGSAKGGHDWTAASPESDLLVNVQFQSKEAATLRAIAQPGDSVAQAMRRALSYVLSIPAMQKEIAHLRAENLHLANAVGLQASTIAAIQIGATEGYEDIVRNVRRIVLDVHASRSSVDSIAESVLHTQEGLQHGIAAINTALEIHDSQLRDMFIKMAQALSPGAPASELRMSGDHGGPLNRR